MVIQKQKFNGRNIANNAVIVDFIRNDVSFKAVIPEGKTEKKYLNIFYSGLLSFALHMTAAVFVIPIVYSMNEEDGTWILMIMWIAALLFIYVPLRLYYGVRLNSEEFRFDVFPELSYMLARARSSFLGKKENKVTISPLCLIDGRYAIERFDNVMFDYQLLGDMAEKIKSIRIIPYDIENEYSWKAVIDFHQPVNDGKMVIKYV